MYPFKHEGISKFLEMKTNRLARLLPIILIEILGLVIVICLIRVPFYPLIHDTPNLHIIAQRILNGAVPYRDIIDMNMPGIYLIHMLVVTMPGNVHLSWFFFHLAWALCTAVTAFFILKPESRLAASLAAITLIAFYLSRKAFYYGQRDFLLLLPVLLGFLAFRRFIGSPHRKLSWMILCGLAFGAAAMIKPLPIFFAGLVSFWLILDKSSTLRQRINAIGAICAGVAIPFAIIAVWMAVDGGLVPFLQLASDLSSVYFNWQHLNLDEMIYFTTLESRIQVVMLLIAGCLTCIHEKRMPSSPVYLFLYGGIVYGLIHYFSQAKGWEYHQLPFSFFAIILTTALFIRLFQSATSRRLAVLAGLCLYLPLIGIIPRAAWIMLHDPSEYLDIFQPAIRKLETDFSQLDLAGKSIQILDMTTGGAYLMYNHQVPLATPYLLDFELQANSNDAYIQFRNDFLTLVQANPPDVFIIAREFDTDQTVSYARYSDWIEFTSWFESNYSLVSDQVEYEIFEMK